MAKMTKKQAEAFVEDPANWEIIPGNDYVRIARLSFSGNEYIRIEENIVVNHADVLIRGDEPLYGFDAHHYRKVDGPFTYGVSKTSIIDEIWKASRSAE